jgi:hypothetical protein
MAQCQETKKQRSIEKGSGRTITKHVKICGLEAAPGSDFCPRHKFMHDLKDQEGRAKDLAAHLNRNVSHKGEGLPQTRAELIRRGYQFVGNKTCASIECKRPIELWRTPNNRLAPFNPMPEADSHAQSHYATCVRADAFRRAS